MDRSTGVVGGEEKMELRCPSRREDQPPVLRVPQVHFVSKSSRVWMVKTCLGFHLTKTFQSRFSPSLLN